jgi:hypothetical protein
MTDAPRIPPGSYGTELIACFYLPNMQQEAKRRKNGYTLPKQALLRSTTYGTRTSIRFFTQDFACDHVLSVDFDVNARISTLFLGAIHTT